MTKDYGRVPTAPGSREPSPDGLGPTGFDPSRDDGFWGPEIVVDGVRPKWLASREPFVWVKTDLWLNHMRRRLSYKSPFAASTVLWHWSHPDGKPCIRAIRLPANHQAYSRDSDGSPKGGDARGSVEDDSAVPERQSPEGSQS